MRIWYCLKQVLQVNYVNSIVEANHPIFNDRTTILATYGGYMQWFFTYVAVPEM